MITNEKLKQCINNKNAMDIVSKVLNYNFKDENKTKALIHITKKYIMEKATSLSDVHNYVKENNLQITDENESERVSRKVNDLVDLLNKNIIGKNKIKSVLDIGVGNGNILTAFGKEIGLSKEKLYGVEYC